MHYFAHDDHIATSFADKLTHFFQNPFAAFLLVTVIAFLFLIATLYVLAHYTSLTITHPVNSTNKKRG